MRYREFYNILSEQIEKKQNILVTLMEGCGQGSRLFFSQGELAAQCGEHGLKPEEIKELSDIKESKMLSLGDRTIFAEVLRKPARLVICGGGHVAQQVVSLAKRTGFTVIVLEDRPYFADEARRAGADQVICQDFSRGLSEITGNSDTYFLVVTRGHRYDGICLESILKKERAYVGMMASRKRGILLKKKLAEDGFAQKDVDSIHTPVGISIHAETPEEIAVSILAELIMTKNSTKKTSGYDKEMLSYLTGEEAPEQKKALATIVSRRGSAPREIGTKMLVLEDGRLIGTIGGGCMESRIRQHCLHMLKNGETEGRLIYEDMSGTEAEDEGLVCGGMIRVYLEVLDS